MAAHGESPTKKQRRSSRSISTKTLTMSLLTRKGTTHTRSANYRLVPEHVDLAARTNSAQTRRRIKHRIFGDNEVDWRSVPTWHENSHAISVLKRMPHLRCQSDEAYFAIILDSFGLQKFAVAPSQESNSDTFIIDGEEMVDMIG